MASTFVKREDNGYGRSNAIKDEPNSGAASPSAMSEDSLYEDAGDLEFPKTDKSDNDVYLMKLPGFLWEKWSQAGDDDEIEIGLVRVAPTEDGRDQKLTLKLSDQNMNRGIPREYDMKITNAASKNTFVFTERDIPRLASKSKSEARDSPPPSQAPPGRSDRFGGLNQQDKARKFEPYYRKAIPKKTAIAGVVKHEVNCNPVENAEYAEFVLARAIKAAQPARTTKMLSAGDAARSNALPPATDRTNESGFGSFVKPNQPSKSKNPDLKAARIPQNDLLDLIFGCFTKYKYWSMKALRNELKQPEPYLKSTLEPVADLVRSGPYNMQWTLKPEYEGGKYLQAINDIAKVSDSDGEDASDDDEDGVEMEDVLPS